MTTAFVSGALRSFLVCLRSGCQGRRPRSWSGSDRRIGTAERIPVRCPGRRSRAPKSLQGAMGSAVQRSAGLQASPNRSFRRRSRMRSTCRRASARSSVSPLRRRDSEGGEDLGGLPALHRHDEGEAEAVAVRPVLFQETGAGGGVQAVEAGRALLALRIPP